MKKNSKILALLLAVAFIAFCTVSTRESKVVQAFDTEASYITIKNSTAFTLENIHVTYNGDKELEVGNIRTSSSEYDSVIGMRSEILPDDRRITEVKISGEIFNGKEFSGTFSGLVNNDTLLTVDMDEDFSLFVTSNIDNFDY